MKFTLLVLALFCNAAPARADDAAPARPKMNLVFILADDLGWRDTSLYGSKFYQTPNIDRLAKRGMMFTQAYAASPLCSPTRSSIMTGLFPARIGITTPSCHVPEVILTKGLDPKPLNTSKAIQAVSETRLKLDYFTLAEALKEAGYATGHFGKWHLGREPYDPLHQGFDVDIPHWYGPGPPGYIAPWKFPPSLHFEGQPGEHIEDRMSQEVVKFIKANKDHPFFVNYWCYSVHSPWGAKPELIEKYRAKVDPKSPQRSPLYAAMVESLDDAVGTVTKTLDDLGLSQNTLIVFFSDNGGVDFHEIDGAPVTSNLPLRSGKGSIYEGGTREPCVVVWPGTVTPGSTSEAIVSSVDWYPTLLDILDVKPREELKFDGISFVPALKGQPLNRDAIFCHFPHYTVSTDPATYVRRGDYKLIRFFCDSPDQIDRFELYNLKDDIGETKDLAAQQPDKVNELKPLIENFLQQTEAVIPVKNPGYDADAYAKLMIRRAKEGKGGTAGGWTGHGDARVSINDGQLLVLVDGNAPEIRADDLTLPKGPYVMELRIKSNAKGGARIFWSTTANAKYGPDVQSRFPLVRDQDWHEYEVKLPPEQPIKHLRIDPAAGPGEVRIEWMRLKDSSGTVIKEWRFENMTSGLPAD